MKQISAALLSNDGKRYAVPVDGGFDLYALAERGPMKKRYLYEGHAEDQEGAERWIEGKE